MKRQSEAVVERFHSAMPPHAGGDTKVFREVTPVGEEHQRLAGLTGSTVDARVALVHDVEPAGAEVVRRRGERISWLVAINHTDRDVVLPVEGVELISGVDTSGGLPVPAGGVAVAREV